MKRRRMILSAAAAGMRRLSGFHTLHTIRISSAESSNQDIFFRFPHALSISARVFSTSEDSSLSPITRLILEHLGDDEPECEKKIFAEDSSMTVAKKLSSKYMDLPPLEIGNPSGDRRQAIIKVIATELGASEDENIVQAADAFAKYVKEGSDRPVLKSQLLNKLRDSITPKYESMFRSMLADHAQSAVKFFISLREDLLQVLRSSDITLSGEDETEQRLKQLDTHLQMVLTTWFSPETLEIRRITYERTSAAVIEKIATKEAVHPLQSLDDLRARLGPDRRVFAAFHPLLPEEPLVFVHVALRNFIPTSMLDVLEAASDDGEDITVATFYSISSTQPGLKGVDLGQILIKKAVKLLQLEFTSINTFITLSPLPRFRKWLQEKLAYQKQGGTFVDESLFSCSGDLGILKQELNSTDADANEAVLEEKLSRLLEDPSSFMSNHATALEPVLMRLAARYLVLEKHRRKPLDLVARFHLHNGAELYQLNYLADTSRKGYHNSLGIMANYKYNLENLNDNQIKYEQEDFIDVNERVMQYVDNNDDDDEGEL